MDDGKAAACCGACEHAAEVARTGGSAPNVNPHLAFPVGPNGVPRGVELVVKWGVEEPRTVPVTKPKLVLGRAGNADIVVKDSMLSRRQCSFDFSTGAVVLEDLDSVCGTYVDGRHIAGPRALRPGEKVTMGNASVEVRVTR